MSRVVWAVLAVSVGVAFVLGHYSADLPGPEPVTPPAKSPAQEKPLSTSRSKAAAAQNRPTSPAAKTVEGLSPETVCEVPPDCPECRCPPPRKCPAVKPASCPSTASVCRSHQEVIGELSSTLEESQKDLEACRVEGPKGRYKGTSAHDRRVLAAQEKNLLLEFPSWGEEVTLPEERGAKFELTAEEKAALEEIYRAFRANTHEQLRQLYADLVGDPEAGRDSTINALIHNIMGLAPREHCQEQILVIIAALSQGQPLPPVSLEMSVCEQAILLLYAGVDQLDDAVTQKLGKPAADALWSGSSSFTYSTSGPPPEPTP